MWQQALRITWRNWRSGEMRLLMVAVFLAVAALCSVSFFSDRLNISLAQDAQQLIGGDVVISSDQPLPAIFLQKANELQLETTQMASFASMVRTLVPEGALSQTRLASIKAVDGAYPLRGVLHIQASLDAPTTTTTSQPQAGEVWIAPEMLVSLRLQMGDEIMLGELPLKVTQLLVIEPDSMAEGFIKLGPRAMINRVDLAATELVQPASRVNYRFAVAGDARATQAYDQWATQLIKEGEGANSEGRVESTDSTPLRGVRMERLETGQPMMTNTLARAQKFLNLVSLLAVLLSAVAIIIATNEFARRHLDSCAMYKVLGLAQKDITFIYAFEVFTVGIIATLGGVIAGYALHHVFVLILASLLTQELPAASIKPLLYGMGVGITLLLTFALPPILQLTKVPPLRVLRRDIGPPSSSALSILGMGMVGFIVLLLIISGDLLLGLITVGGFILAVLLFAILTYFISRLLKHWILRYPIPLGIRLAIRAMVAKPMVLIIQTSALAIGMLALLLLFLLRTDLVASWQQATPANAPSRFVINIMPDQAQPFKDMLEKSGVTGFDWYPMILGRMSRINEQAPNLESYDDQRTRRLVDREFSLSYAAQPPAHNEIVEGKWVENEDDAISVEAGLMESLGLKLGDRLEFTVAGIEMGGKITSVRRLDWSSMHVNFFVMFPKEKVEDLPESYITAFKAPDDIYFDNQLVQNFPNITNINVSTMLLQVKMVMDQVIQAVEFIFMFALAAGVIVLYATISSTREQRTHDFAVMRAIGAGNKLLKQVQRAELMGMGALAGFLAALVALGISGVLIVFVFDFAWKPNLWVLLLGAGGGVLLAWFAGWLSLGSILKQTVTQTLRTVLD